MIRTKTDTIIMKHSIACEAYKFDYNENLNPILAATFTQYRKIIRPIHYQQYLLYVMKFEIKV